LPTVASEVAYHLEHGQAHRALPKGDPLRKLWMISFTVRTDYGAREFFEVCGWRYRSQYFTLAPPPLLRIPDAQRSRAGGQ
jgi:hypothetical protein